MTEINIKVNRSYPHTIKAEIKSGFNANNQDKTITENGVYKADVGYTGLGTVTVDVESESVNNETLPEITENGTYTPSDGYTGFNEFTVNIPTQEIINQDKTITENGIYTADESYTGLGTVTVDVDTVKNETLPTITENGMYKPSDGFTGFNEFTVDVKSGATVKAVNATGKALTKGDKVWLNKDVRIGDTYFRLNSSSRNGAGIMSPSGLFGYSSGSTVSLVNDQSTIISSYSFPVGSSIAQVFYGKNQSVFIRNNFYACRIDEEAQYNLAQYTNFLGEDFVYNNTTKSFDQIDISNGSILNSWVYGNSLGQLATEMIKVGDSVYRFIGPSYAYRYKLEDDYSVTKEAITYTAPASENLSPVGVTADNKYVICGTSSSTYWDNNTANALRIVEIISPTEVKVLSQAEMPVELQGFYNNKSYYITFNPYNGILCISGKGTNEYLFAQYSNGTFNKLPIELPSEFTRFDGGIMASYDLSRLCLGGYGYSSFTGPYVLNLESKSGNVAIKYSTNTVNQETITGVASDNAETGTEFEVSGNAIDDGKIFGATVRGFIGSVDENGVYQKPTIPMSLNFKGVKEISERGLYHMFYKKHIESFLFPDLEKVDEKGLMYACNEAIIDGDIIFQKLIKIVGYGVAYLFMDTDVNSVTFSALKTSDCEWIGVIGCKTKALYFPELEEITGGTFGDFAISNYGYENMMLQTISIPKLKRVTGKGKIYHIANTSQIKSFEFTALEEVLNTGLQSAFDNNTVTEYIYFPKLRQVVSDACSKMCYYAINLKAIYFNALVLVSRYSFGNYSGDYAFSGCKNLTEIHFRADMQEIISTMVGYADKWGATNATIYFDL